MHCSAVVIYMAFVSWVPCFCVKLKLYRTNKRMSGIIDTKTARSLLECLSFFGNSGGALSFSYMEAGNICELSSSYPENSATEAAGWKVYAPIVNGGWADWTNWGMCTVTCIGGTSTRTRACSNPPASNGGTPCPGDPIQTITCYERPCECNCYGWSNDDYSAMSIGSSQQEVCEGLNGNVYAEGDDEKCPFCGGCWCCKPLPLS